jgi:DNA repair exonuclease SbcCD ATPase subunit
MARKILAWILIVLGSLFLVLSVVGIFAVWIYNEPVTQKVITQLSDFDSELAIAEATLKSSEQELARALRILDASQAALEKLTQKTSTAENLFDSIQSTLDERLLPELKTTRSRLVSARTTLQSLQSILTGVGNFIPGLDLSLPGKVVTDLITSTETLDTEIASIETLAQQASTFVGDTSYLLGGDLTETRKSLETFLEEIQNYEKKIAGWRQQAADLKANTPTWIDQASMALTIILLWFGISQFGLLLHGLNMLRDADPFLGLRRSKVVVREDGVDEIA